MIYRKAFKTFIINHHSPLTNAKRNFSGKDIKRFYKKVTISQSEGGGFEINLDKRKLKTPFGTLFTVPTEALAVGVANEWEAQQNVIKKHTMHLTSLSNTAIDNPSRRSRETVLGAILEFLDTDTICYHLSEPVEVANLMANEWDPILTWFQDRYDVTIEATTGIGVPVIPEVTKKVISQHLDYYNDWALVGYEYAVECLKSLVITSCLMDRHLSVEKAVSLSRLEYEFQISRWGNVEWHHDVDLMSLRAHVASAVIFTHLNSEDRRTVFNKHDNLHMGSPL